MATQPNAGPLTQGFANSDSYYGGYGITRNGGYFHNGWDLAAGCGSPVIAPEPGTVTTGWESGGYGNYIRFTGVSGWQHDLGHLASFAVPSGSFVPERQLIAYQGSTGNSTGCHTHWTTKPPNYDRNNGVLGAVDPQLFLNQGGSITDTSVNNDRINGIYQHILMRDVDPGALQARQSQSSGQIVADLFGVSGDRGEYFNKVFEALSTGRANAPSQEEVENYRNNKTPLPDVWKAVAIGLSSRKE